MINIGVILSGGQGERFCAKIAKQYMSLNGKLVIQYVIDAFIDSKLFDEIIIVSNHTIPCIESYKKLYGNIHIIPGGDTRNASVNEAIQYAKRFNPKNILFHDAARPFIKSEDLKIYIDSLNNGYSAAITKEVITDALWNYNRKKTFLVQTPEAFDFKTIASNFIEKYDYVAIYEHLIDGLSFGLIKHVELNHINLKITNPRDIYTAEQLMKYQEVVRRTSNVKGKDILIFGGTGGIGSAISRKLIEQGANVVAVGSEIDLSWRIMHLPPRINKEWDCIIYSAGAYNKDEEGIIENFDRMMNVNFRSITSILENSGKLIRKGGSFIALGSTAAVKGRAGIAMYSSTKAALNAFVEGMAEPLSKKGIRINVICPAKVATPLQTKLNPLAKQEDMIQPDDLADIIIGYIDIASTGNIAYVRVGEC